MSATTVTSFGGFSSGVKPGFGVSAPPGAGFGGFSAGRGIGTTLGPPGQPQFPPYKGIKGPGSSTEWLQGSNLSSLRDDILFEDLPAPLQQHLTDLNTFIQAEHGAKQVVEAFLTDSATPNSAPTASYRDLVKKLNQLTSGENAIDVFRVDCFEREVQVQRLRQTLDRCEEDILHYMKHIWTPLSEVDFTRHTSAAGPKPTSEPFQRVVRDIQECMDEISLSIAELEAAVVPCGHRARALAADDSGRNGMASEFLAAPGPSYLAKDAGGLELPDTPPLGLGSAMSAHPISRINTSLSNQLTTLLNLAARTQRLHTRADSARDLFTHTYGASEAELLLAQRHQQAEMSAGPRRPFVLRSSSVTVKAEANQETVGDIHRRSAFPSRPKALNNGERRMQYDILLERNHQEPPLASDPAKPAAGLIPSTSFPGAPLGAPVPISTATTGFSAAQTAGLTVNAPTFAHATVLCRNTVTEAQERVAEMQRSMFVPSHPWRKQVGELAVKSFDRCDNLGPLKISLLAPTSDRPDAPTSVRRSAYSVLRMRNAQSNVCAQNLLPCPSSGTRPEMCRCCCSALLYRSGCDEEALSSQISDEERERDDFVFSLKLAEVEHVLRELVAPKGIEGLVGPALAHARWIGMCEAMPDVCEGDGSWVVRVLLTPEEEHRIKWLREDGVKLSEMLARIPSFKALYVASYTVGEELELCQFEAIERRMGEASVEWDMCDAAAACFLAMRRSETRPFCCHVLRDVLLQIGEEQCTEGAGARSVTLRHVLGGVLLLRMIEMLLLEVQGANAEGQDPPMYLFLAVTEFFSFAESFPSSGFTSVLRGIATQCRMKVLSLASVCTVPAGSPCLSDFTLWLLREATDSASCHLHFRRMTLHSHAEAITLLEKSSLLLPQCPNLRVVVDALFPLLDASDVDDFYVIVFGEVLSRLEERLRRNAQSFTEDDFRSITSLGARLFEGPGNRLCQLPSQPDGRCPFDAKKLEQLEQLQVMGGSPWSFIQLSWEYLREIMRSLLGDRRRSDVELQCGGCHTLGTAPPRSVGGSRGVWGGSLISSTSELCGGQVTRITSASSGERSVAGYEQPLANGITKVGRGFPLLLPSSLSSLRERFVAFVEGLVRTHVSGDGARHQNSGVVSDDLFAFVSKHMSLPNIHDQYRQKIYLLVNIMTKETYTQAGDRGTVSGSREDDIPPELRYLVTSLSLMLSPWAAVMILREVLSESSGMNPRYTYVLNAAIDLQLPTSTTRSRMATTLNMWRFISSQSSKMTFAEHVSMKRRCAVNIPLSYILSSYWSLLTWLTLLAIVGLNVAGLDLESQYAATCLFREFAPPEEVVVPLDGGSCRSTVNKVVSSYIEDRETIEDGVPLISNGVKGSATDHTSEEGLLSSAAHIFPRVSGQRRRLTVISISAEGRMPSTEQSAQEFACATAVLHELASRSVFPFYLWVDQVLSVDLIVARIAERIRRVSFDNAWLVGRAVFRTFPLGRARTEYGLVTHTCAQANSKRRRITFLLYIQRNVPVPPLLLLRLSESVLSQQGDLVVVAHEASLRVGGSNADVLKQLAENHAIRSMACRAVEDEEDGRGQARFSVCERLWAHGTELVVRVWELLRGTFRGVPNTSRMRSAYEGAYLPLL